MPWIAAMWLVCLVPDNAYAYIDPGTGSLLYQTILAAIVGASFVFRRIWVKAARAITSRLKRTDLPGGDDRPTH